MYNVLSVFILIGILLLVGAGGVSAENLVKNGDFESLEGWELSNPSLVELSPDAVEGRSSLKLTADPNSPPDTESTAVWQMIDIKVFDPEGEYRLQFRAKADHFPLEYMVFMGVMQGEQLPVAIGLEWRQVGTQWQDAALDFRDMNPVATGVRLMVRLKAPGTLWIDDLRITKLPKGTIGAEDRALKDLPKFVGSKDSVQIADGRRFIVQGKPFFPIGMWGIDFPSENKLKDLREFGFNVSGTGHLFAKNAEGTKEFLDMVQKYGLKVVGVTRFNYSGDTEKTLADARSSKNVFEPILEVTRNHPAFFAYDIADEPAWAGNNLSAFAEGAHFIREKDPNHPIFSNQAPRQAISLLKRYYRFVDIGGSDIYPYWNGEPDRHSDLPNKTLSVVGDECVKNLTALGNEKPVLMTIQAFGWSDGNTDPATKSKGYAYPPAELLRFMAYNSVTSGASGIMFFQDQRYDHVNPLVKPVSLELSAMHDVLAAPNAASQAKASDKAIQSVTRKLGGWAYIIAVNTTNKEIKTDISLPTTDLDWTVLFENRKLKSGKKSVADTFKPWDVHIYTNCVDSSILERIEAKTK